MSENTSKYQNSISEVNQCFENKKLINCILDISKPKYHVSEKFSENKI